LTGVGGIELEIADPTVEKKVLKELAMRELSEVRDPLTFSQYGPLPRQNNISATGVIYLSVVFNRV
jgi:hypothetical protein